MKLQMIAEFLRNEVRELWPAVAIIAPLAALLTIAAAGFLSNIF